MQERQAVTVNFTSVTRDKKVEDGGVDCGVVGGGCSAFPLTGGSHTRFKREENSNWLLCCPASLGLVSTKRATGKYLFLSILT